MPPETSTQVRRFFGDRLRTFCLTPPMIAELQRKCDAGIGAIYGRVAGRQFHHADLCEVIRLALIGGGAAPEEALALVKAYAEPAPIVTPLALALAILVATFEGSDAVEHDVEPPPPAPAPATDTVSVAWEIAPNIYRMTDGSTQLNLDEVA